MSNHKIEDGYLKIDFQAIIADLDDELLDVIAQYISWERILEQLDHHLRGHSDWSSYGGGFSGGQFIREHIEKLQGTKDQRIKDLEDRIGYLERQEEYLNTYRDWYFRSYHGDYDNHLRLEKLIGSPKDPEEVEEASS